MQVGAVSFSNWAFLDFHLNQFSSKEKAKEAVGSILQVRGDTNTAGALSYMQVCTSIDYFLQVPILGYSYNWASPQDRANILTVSISMFRSMT